MRLADHEAALEAEKVSLYGHQLLPAMPLPVAART